MLPYRSQFVFTSGLLPSYCSRAHPLFQNAVSPLVETESDEALCGEERREKRRRRRLLLVPSSSLSLKPKKTKWVPFLFFPSPLCFRARPIGKGDGRVLTNRGRNTNCSKRDFLWQHLTSGLLLTAEMERNGKYCHAKIQKRRSKNSTLLWALFLAILLLLDSSVLGYNIVQTPRLPPKQLKSVFSWYPLLSLQSARHSPAPFCHRDRSADATPKEVTTALPLSPIPPPSERRNWDGGSLFFLPSSSPVSMRVSIIREKVCGRCQVVEGEIGN